MSDLSCACSEKNSRPTHVRIRVSLAFAFVPSSSPIAKEFGRLKPKFYETHPSQRGSQTHSSLSQRTSVTNGQLKQSLAIACKQRVNKNAEVNKKSLSDAGQSTWIMCTCHPTRCRTPRVAVHAPPPLTFHFEFVVHVSFLKHHLCTLVVDCLLCRCCVAAS